MLRQFEEIIGQPISDFRLVAGGSLILYIGPKQVDSELTRWRLHMDSAWRLDQGGNLILRSQDACVETKEEAEPSLSLLRQVQNEKVEDMSVGQGVKNITLHLSSGYCFTTFSNSANDDGWELRCSDGRRIGMAQNDITQLDEWSDEPDVAKA